ncbi:MAG: sulfur oxidation protein SoxY [Proteobacteria bacterium]|nr:sulfur oxidation protein SoxY [Pseudomonadota bacterium]
MTLDRRQVLAVTLLPLAAAPRAQATPESLQAAITAYAGGAEIRDGRVAIEIAELVENGNAVPLAVQVAGVAAGQLRRVAVFTSHNPQPEVAVFHFSPRFAGRARVDTRIRLATSQRVLALATLADGSVWRAQADVLVTLAACVEG